MTTTALPVTDRTRIGRLPDRQVTDRAALHAVLDRGMVAHVGIGTPHGPVVLPLAYARDGERLLLHGSTGGGLLRAAASGAPVAVAVTHLDALVYARSVFDSSMNYRSAVVFGVPRVVPEEGKLAALEALTEHLMPGRWHEVRPPTRRELAATVVLELPLDEASVKVRAGGVGDTVDADSEAWAGVLPIRVVAGDPEPAADMPPHRPTPPSLGLARDRIGRTEPAPAHIT